jgi:hypothetical protein
MHASPRQSTILGCGLIFCLLAPRAALADMGPRLNTTLTFTLTDNGQPLRDVEVRAVILELKPESSPGIEVFNNGKRERETIPSLDSTPLPGEDEKVWTYNEYYRFGELSNGRLSFRGYYQGRDHAPSRFRLAVYLPAKDRLFVSEPVDRHFLFRDYRADLRPDSTLTVTPERTGKFLVDWIVGAWNVGFWVSLALTVLIEYWIVALYARRYPAYRVRLLVSCVILNLLTVPVVWFVTMLNFLQGPPLYSLLLFVLAEIIVVLVEGGWYTLICRPGLGLWGGMLLSFTANAASLAAGVISGVVANQFGLGNYFG